ncbi:MAG: hypothetical protein WHT08_16220 [Bryobacteraceae bacterium]
MQPAPTAPHTAEPAPLDAAELIRHLAHELRQPLSGIESAAYFVDMVVSEARPDLIPHCRRLRAMVLHASWLLDDALLCAALPGGMTVQPLATALAQAGRRLYEQEEAVLDLHLENDGWIHAPAALPRLIEHLVSFFRDVAGCQDPVHASLACEGEWVVLRLWAAGSEDPEDAARSLRSSASGGALGRFLEFAGGRFETGAQASAGRLELMLRLPACEQGQ